MAKDQISEGQPKLKRKQYEKELRRLQAELCRLQDWVKLKGLRIIVLFEGRDGAGKGGTIKAITERVSPRVFHVVALPAPSDREKSQIFIQRYTEHFPAAGEIVTLRPQLLQPRWRGVCHGLLHERTAPPFPRCLSRGRKIRRRWRHSAH